MRHCATSSVKSLKKCPGRGNSKHKDTDLRVGCMCFKNCQESQWSWGTVRKEGEQDGKGSGGRGQVHHGLTGHGKGFEFYS